MRLRFLVGRKEEVAGGDEIETEDTAAYHTVRRAALDDSASRPYQRCPKFSPLVLVISRRQKSAADSWTNEYGKTSHPDLGSDPRIYHERSGQGEPQGHGIHLAPASSGVARTGASQTGGYSEKRAGWEGTQYLRTYLLSELRMRRTCKPTRVGRACYLVWESRP